MIEKPARAVRENMRAATPRGASAIAQSTIFMETRWTPEKKSTSTSDFGSRIRASAIPKKSAKTIRASISPESASTADFNGLLGMSERRLSAHD